ncbi:MAG: MerR family transcriptional regulator [Gammaproteobacteria bacterium]|nr:MerR family transcriptional regulator [Gammaproteobacteria bacterium]
MRHDVTEDLYRIGAVAKRTGISPECLRAWERRYGLEPAERAGKTRFYDGAQIERLTVIKALLDQGHPISQVIHLPGEALSRRLSPGRASTLATSATPKVALVGAALVRAHRDAEHARRDRARFDVVAEWAGVADLYRDAVPSQLDCVVVYLPSLDAEQIEKVRYFLQGPHIVVAFKYATAADLAACRDGGYPMLRWPADWDRLEALVVAGGVREIDDTARRFSDEELLHVSQAASRAACDCPRHLAVLIGELNDYASHAARCRGDDRHDVIGREVEVARAHLERALEDQIEEHGLLVTAN